MARNPIRTAAAVLTLLSSMAVFAGGDPDPPRTAPRTPAGSIAPPTRIPEPVPANAGPAGKPVTTAQMPRDVRRAVVADAAKRFNVAESAVVITGAEQVTWSDGSLGCAEPGGMYTQALVPGYRVMAKTAEGQMVYHTDERGTVVNCGAGLYRPGKKNLPAEATGTGAEPRTQPPVRATPDR